MKKLCIVWFLLTLVSVGFGQNQDTTSQIRINQIGYEVKGPKTAVYTSFNMNENVPSKFSVLDKTGKKVFEGDVVKTGEVPSWHDQDKKTFYFWTMEFSKFQQAGTFTLKVGDEESFQFVIGTNVLFTKTLGGLLHCFTKMRNTMDEDKSVRLVNSNDRIDLYGGYNEASGDNSKHITHLQFTNYMATQEIPMLPWALLRAYELNSKIVDTMNLKDSLFDEVSWGLDYLMRSLADEGYFYSTIFNGWEGEDWKAGRLVCSYECLDINSIPPVFDTTTSTYNTSMREGGGIAVAALAKAAAMGVNSRDYSAVDFKIAAIKAYDHIKSNNKKYADDGVENSNDFYCGLIAAVDLYHATKEDKYKKDAKEWAKKLLAQYQDEGWLASDPNANRPYYHAGEEGLPIIALEYYMYIDNSLDDEIRKVVKKNVEWYKTISHKKNNPFNYAKQYNKAYVNGQYENAEISYFIPQKNESGYWWQGENARASSMGGALLLAAKIIDKKYTFGTDDLTTFGMSQIDWVLGKNPFEICMLFGYGTVNHEDYNPAGQRSSIVGGICNGITSFDHDSPQGREGEGIGWAPYDDWHNWRWLEQWLPHETNYVLTTAIISQLIHYEPVNIATPNVSHGKSHFSVKTHYSQRVLSGVISGNVKQSRIQLVNIQGRVLKTIHLDQGTRSFSISTKNVARGTYFVTVRMGGSVAKKAVNIH